VRSAPRPGQPAGRNGSEALPFLRFSRDDRGYESTFLMHAVREPGKPSTRILYWFRTPPNVRVGRAALDEEAIRLIEQTHPDVAFDWTRILRSVAAPAPPGPPNRRHPRRQKPAARERVEPSPARPAEQRAGPPGFDRLKARYAELLARITERISDPALLDELRTQAERLNPETWVTDDEARQGVEGFDAAWAALRARLGLGGRRRRRRGGSRRRRHQAGTGAAPSSGGGTGGSSDPEPGDSQL